MIGSLVCTQASTVDILEQAANAIMLLLVERVSRRQWRSLSVGNAEMTSSGAYCTGGLGEQTQVCTVMGAEHQPAAKSKRLLGDEPSRRARLVARLLLRPLEPCSGEVSSEMY